MANKPTEKSTKAEILTAYNELVAEKKAADDRIKALQKQATTQPVAAAPTVKAESKVPTMNAATSKDRIDRTIASLEHIQLGFGTAIGELSEQLTTEAAKLVEIRTQVATEITALKTLHDLDVSEDICDELLERYETSAKTFDRELTQRKEAADLEIDTQNKTWQKEQEQQHLSSREQAELDRKNSQRESQEYKYNIDLERKLDREQWEQQQTTLERELAEIKEVQTKAWELKEKSIADRETQFHEVKDKVAGLEQELETAIRKAKEEGKGIANSQAKIKSDLYAKDVEGQKRFYESRIESLQQNIDSQSMRVDRLSQQLEAALQQVQDLAVKAIEGSANANSYQTLKEITLEQAKSQAKAK
jgi:uncharacterized coiled-coil protein SlyX